MATTAEVVEQLNEATNELGDGVRRNAEVTDRVATKLEELRDQVGGLDSSIAAQLTPLVDELRGTTTELSATSDRLGVLATDPEQPVPPVEPAPETPTFR